MSYHCKSGWGIDSLKQARNRSDIVIIVDTLSFSTAVTTAVFKGAKIYPFASQEEAKDYAKNHSIALAVHRDKVPTEGKYSLSPLTYNKVTKGLEIALYSLNGATLCNNTVGCPKVLIGSLLNAEYVATVAGQIAEESNHNITVVAAGEIEHEGTRESYLRKAEEDLIGAGAIMSYLTGTKCSKAKIAESYFHEHKTALKQLLYECPSGKYLIERGFSDDVLFASSLNSKPVAPVLCNNVFVAL